MEELIKMRKVLEAKYISFPQLKTHNLKEFWSQIEPSISKNNSKDSTG